MLEWIRQLGRGGIEQFAKLGRANLFLLKTLVGIPEVLRRPSLLVAQLWSVGVLSLLIIVVSGLFVGMVLALQGHYTLVDFGAEESLGVAVALSIVRELGPVLAAILAVADAFDAMSSDRPYRKGMPAEKVDDILRAGAGKQWDPETVELYLGCRHAIRIPAWNPSVDRPLRRSRGWPGRWSGSPATGSCLTSSATPPQRSGFRPGS